MRQSKQFGSLQGNIPFGCPADNFAVFDDVLTLFYVAKRVLMPCGNLFVSVQANADVILLVNDYAFHIINLSPMQ